MLLRPRTSSTTIFRISMQITCKNDWVIFERFLMACTQGNHFALWRVLIPYDKDVQIVYISERMALLHSTELWNFRVLSAFINSLYSRYFNLYYHSDRLIWWSIIVNLTWSCISDQIAFYLLNIDLCNGIHIAWHLIWIFFLNKALIYNLIRKKE